MDKIIIRVVRVRGGFAGVTFSDRWNLHSLRSEYSYNKGVLAKDINTCDSKSRLDSFRKKISQLGFALRVEKGVCHHMSVEESSMFDPDPLRACFHDRVFMGYERVG